jgi:hypothetical protein
MIVKTACVAFMAAVNLTAASAQDAAPQCKPAPGQPFVGGPATQESGAAIVAATGARVFQWVFEGSAVTMDYRPERVRVTYNRAMEVVAVSCG